MARIFDDGRGGQCSRNPSANGLCGICSKNLVHGRVDGPIPPEKLTEFEYRAGLSAKRVQGANRVEGTRVAASRVQGSGRRTAVPPGRGAQAFQRGGGGVEQRGEDVGTGVTIEGSVEEPRWKRFTPCSIDNRRCMGRTFSGGRGGQCGSPL